MSPMQPAALDPLRFPLAGSRLIEASAGTGKTFTIAALYVRLVLGHGGENGFARPLTPPEILVVTFTEAATKELRDRIRSRLAEAARCFGADPATVAPRAAGEDLLHDLRADYPPQQWPACARRLQLAAEWMDEAAVSTIHGWCNRMLREYAFDSGSLFTQALEADQSELLADSVRDYWRIFLAPLPPAAVDAVLAWWSGPDALRQALRNLIDHAAQLPESNNPAEALRFAEEEKRQRLAELKAPWLRWADELHRLLNDAVAAKCVNGRKLQARYYTPWLEKLRAWAVDPDQETVELNSGWARLTHDGLADAWNKGEPPSHPALDAIAALPAALAALPDARTDLLCHAARWVSARFAAEQQRRAQMGFNDLLTRLDDALRGPNGERLAERIRTAFPVALIDEFQDTDPVQYRIFDAVYGVARNARETALILIGDPKQAIYAFRGADIHTYLAARRDCAGRLHTLKRNYRSTAAMVAATNRCFEVAERRPGGAGAFLFRSDGDNPVPFIAADARGRNDVFVVENSAPAALTVWHLPPGEGNRAVGKTAYRERMAAVCASAMVRLLNDGAAGRAGFLADGALRPLRPADFAVLVNNRDEAEKIRAALAARGVRSVYLSETESVFRSPQVAEVQHWLTACAEPDDPRLIRAALATPTLGLGWQQLDRLNRDELAWETCAQRFRGYGDCWRRQGVLPMLRRLLHDFDVPARLLGGAAGGERILTDLLHLAELLQQASALLDGEHALIRHLAEQCREAERATGAGDARQIRLESDADLVQVVTVHKSKGLEYPLVFLPFACGFREVGKDELPLKYHDDDGRLQLALRADEALLARADRERLGEDLRKFYVALTRARHATWVGTAPLDKLERSAFGYLLGGGETIAPEQLQSALDALRGDCADIAIATAPPAGDECLRTTVDRTALGPARESLRQVREHWWIASYSSLRTLDEEQRAAPDTATEELLQEALHPPPTMPRAVPASAHSLHAFPRGAEVGTFLHALLEWVAEQGFAAVANDAERLRETIARRCALRGWSAWIEPLSGWFRQLLTTPLPLPGAGSVALAELKSAIAEMEFWLAAHHVDIVAIERLVRTHTLDGAARPALRPGQLNGMLKGFIDLVFEHDGRFYVADYKSNWLGSDDDAYTPAAMRAAVLHARYELQYVLYLLALHRLLKSRLPDYDYDRHIGGAVYLFLRGSGAPGRGVHAERPPRQLIESLDRLFTGSGRRASA